MTTATSFTTYWGNSVQGINLTWSIDSAASAATPGASDKLKITMDVNLYGVVAPTTQDTATGVAVTGNEFYFLFLNPIDKFAYDAAITANASDTAKIWYDSQVTFDGAVVTLDAEAKTMAYIKGTADVVSDCWCKPTLSNGAYDGTLCFKDVTGEPNYKKVGTNDYTAPTETNYCVETWTYGTTKRCTRVQVKTDRVWTSTTNAYFATQALADTDNSNTAVTSVPPSGWAVTDMNLEYRKYSVTTGWRLPAAETNAPGKQDFAAIDVDFSRFRRAPETYSSALYKLQLATTALVGGIAVLAF